MDHLKTHWGKPAAAPGGRSRARKEHMPITYEDFKQVQEKVEKLATSRAALCDPKGVPV